MRTLPPSIESRADERRQNLRTAFRKGFSSAPMRGADGPTPIVSVQGYQYLVDFGQKENPRYHRVSKDKTCSCGAPNCEAIGAVRQYLHTGGMRAPEPLDPTACPICGGDTFRDPNWDGKHTKTPGWRCQNGGLSHFLQAKAQHIQKNLSENGWLFPPAPGYPGVRREEIMTSEECAAISRRVFAETGYDPTA
jgi:hypothetical protein